MGFWSDTKKFVTASTGAISHGMTLLADGASDLEATAHRLNIEARIRRLEQERKRMGEEWFLSSNSGSSVELTQLYTKLLEDFRPDHNNLAGDNLAQLLADLRAFKVKIELQKVVALNDRIKSEKACLAIDAINLRKQLITLLSGFIIISEQPDDAPLIKRARSRVEELKVEIDELEPKRKVINSVLHDSGVKKIEAQIFDGKLNGYYREWYANGAIRWHIPFAGGHVQGTATNWRSDTSKYMEVSLGHKSQSYRFYSFDGLPLISAWKSASGLAITFEKPPLRGVAFQFLELPSKFSLALKCLFKPRVLRLFWSARKPGPGRELSAELLAAARALDPVLQELVSIQQSR